MTYRSPVADILFSLQAVAGLPEMIGSNLHGDFDWETISSVVEEAGRFATDEIAPLNQLGRRRGGALRKRRRHRCRADSAKSIAAGLRGAGAASRPRPNSAEWDCLTLSTSPAPNLERRLYGLRAVSVADRGGDWRLEGARVPPPGRHLSSGDDLRALDRNDKSDRASGRLRPQRGETRAERAGDGTYRLSAKKSSSLRRTRHGRKHRPSCTGAAARGAAGTRGLSLSSRQYLSIRTDRWGLATT